jgi:hypothetical protein
MSDDFETDEEHIGTCGSPGKLTEEGEGLE